MMDAFEYSSGETNIERIDAAPQISLWDWAGTLWFIWWLLVGLLAVFGLTLLFMNRPDVGGLSLLGALFFSWQTLGWWLTSSAERYCLAVLKHTDMIEPAPPLDRWSPAARLWRVWHLFSAVVFAVLLVAVIQANGLAVRAFWAIWLLVQIVALIACIGWVVRWRRTAKLALTAQLMGFRFAPRPHVPDISPLAAWPFFHAPQVVVSNVLMGNVGTWEVLCLDARFPRGENALANRYQSMVIASPALNNDFLLTPRVTHEQLHWLGLLFHLFHFIGWIVIAFELFGRLIRRPHSWDANEVDCGDPHFAKKYCLQSEAEATVSRIFHPDVRAELMPKQWLESPWHLHHASGFALATRPGQVVPPAQMPEFIASVLKLIALLQDAERLAEEDLAATQTLEESDETNPVQWLDGEPRDLAV